MFWILEFDGCRAEIDHPYSQSVIGQINTESRLRFGFGFGNSFKCKSPPKLIDGVMIEFHGTSAALMA